MKFSKEDNLRRIADALERISPLPIDNKNLDKSNLFLWKTNPDRLVFLENDYSSIKKQSDIELSDIILKLKNYWTVLSENNKTNIWEYLNNLVKVAELV